jgi:hypothetical protein
MKNTERQHKSPSVSKRVYCSRRRHPNQHSVTVSKLVVMKLNTYITEIREIGNWRKYDTNKRAHREVLRCRFHISNYTKHNSKGLFGGRLPHAIHCLYAYLHRLVYNYVLQLPALQSRQDPSKPTSKQIMENADGVLSLLKYCAVKCGKNCRISDPLT